MNLMDKLHANLEKVCILAATSISSFAKLSHLKNPLIRGKQIIVRPPHVVLLHITSQIRRSYLYYVWTVTETCQKITSLELMASEHQQYPDPKVLQRTSASRSLLRCVTPPTP